MSEISRLKIDDLHVEYKISFEEVITKTWIDEFADLTGDRSTLHMDDDFARCRGFKGRVVHGVFLLGFLSRAIGMYLPGENALLQTMNTRFISPAYIGDTVVIKLTIEQISNATNSVVIGATIENRTTEKLIIRSKIQVGLTTQKTEYE